MEQAKFSMLKINYCPVFSRRDPHALALGQFTHLHLLCTLFTRVRDPDNKILYFRGVLSFKALLVLLARTARGGKRLLPLLHTLFSVTNNKYNHPMK